MAVDLSVLGGGLAAAATLATGAWAWWQKNQRAQAQTKAEVAMADAGRAIADANGEVYKLVTERLRAVEADIERLRDELAHERRRSRAMELHIIRLENLMRRAGIEPPAFEDPDRKPVE
jgi:uncharacterized protein HemX